MSCLKHYYNSYYYDNAKYGACMYGFTIDNIGEPGDEARFTKP